MNKVQAYLTDVNKEMRKVNWPDRPDLISNTLITIGATIGASLYIYGIDQVVSSLLEVIYSFS
ncbi:MAG: preprotein translocase subunit SecE [Bacteroidetes bacterium]|jgi:preprotein translocase subunit SecE|nr:preprotein translocase subunit SecE [Bacteroidota bacterium]